MLYIHFLSYNIQGCRSLKNFRKEFLFFQIKNYPPSLNKTVRMTTAARTIKAITPNSKESKTVVCNTSADTKAVLFTLKE